MIGNGMGRARGKHKLTLEETMRWRTVLLSYVRIDPDVEWPANLGAVVQ